MSGQARGELPPCTVHPSAIVDPGATIGADLLSTGLKRPHGCRIDPSGRLVIADSDNDRIVAGVVAD